MKWCSWASVSQPLINLMNVHVRSFKAHQQCHTSITLCHHGQKMYSHQKKNRFCVQFNMYRGYNMYRRHTKSHSLHLRLCAGNTLTDRNSLKLERCRDYRAYIFVFHSNSKAWMYLTSIHLAIHALDFFHALFLSSYWNEHSVPSKRIGTAIQAKLRKVCHGAFQYFWRGLCVESILL